MGLCSKAGSLGDPGKAGEQSRRSACTAYPWGVGIDPTKEGFWRLKSHSPLYVTSNGWG
jgi:hypothetical protein